MVELITCRTHYLNKWFQYEYVYYIAYIFVLDTDISFAHCRFTMGGPTNSLEMSSSFISTWQNLIVRVRKIESSFSMASFALHKYKCPESSMWAYLISFDFLTFTKCTWNESTMILRWYLHSICSDPRVFVLLVIWLTQ